MKRYFISHDLVDSSLSYSSDISQRLFSTNLLDEYGFFYKNNYNTALLGLNDLASLVGAIIVAEGGMGKSYELRNLEHEFKDDEICFVETIRYLGNPQALGNLITRAAENDKTKILIDGLDEVPELIPFLIASLRNLNSQVNIFIASRNIPQLKCVSEELSLPVVALLPFSQTDVIELAREKGVSHPSGFIETVIDLSLGGFAAKPLSCIFLLSSYLKDSLRNFSNDNLWQKGILHLCEENDSSSRRLLNYEGADAYTCMNYASRIAIILKLTGKSIIWNGLAANCPEHCLDFSPFFNADFSKEIFRETLHRGIFIPVGTDCFRFSHVMHWDYLAANGMHKFIERKHWEAVILTPDKKSIFPQWEGVAPWLAALDDKWRDLAFKLQPELLATSDKVIKEVGAGKLCRAIIKRANSLDYWNRHESSIRTRLHTLRSPESLKVLATVFETSTSVAERELAISIVRECKAIELEDYLVDIFCDSSEEHGLRSQAAYSLQDFASYNARNACKRLLTDINSDIGLKGLVFRLCWPELISIEEIAPHLLKEDRHIIDAYEIWLTHDFPESLESLSLDDCLGLLTWAIENIERRDDYHDSVFDMKRQIYTLCWKKFDDPRIYYLLARGLFNFQRIYESPFADSSIYGIPATLILERKDFIAGVLKRHIVAEYMIAQDDISGEELEFTSLVISDDFEYVFNKIQVATDNENATKWVRCLNRIRHAIPLPEESARWDVVHSRFPAIFEQDSINAQLARKKYDDEERERKKERSKPFEKKKQTRQDDIAFIKASLQARTASDYFYIIISFFANETRNSIIDYRDTDIWKELSSEEHQMLVIAAKDFLFKITVPKVKENTVYPAYCRAFYMLFTENRQEFELLPETIWAKFASHLFQYVSFDHHNVLFPIFEYFNKKFPSIFQQALANKLQQEALSDFTSYLVRFKALLTEKSLKSIIENCSRKKLNNKQRSTILFSVYKVNENIIREHIAEKYLAKGWSLGRYDYRISLLIVACFPQYLERFVQKAIEERRWGKKWLENIVGLEPYDFHLISLFGKLSLSMCVKLYIWIHRIYPMTNMPERIGAYHSNITDKMKRFKGELFRLIIEADEIGVVAALEKIYKCFPEDDWLQDYILKARKRELKLKHMPLDTVEIKSILERLHPRQRVVTSPQALLELICELLFDYQEYLTGKRYPMVESLWNYSADQLKPKSEEDFSDNILNYLQLRLVDAGVIINREVQLNRGINGKSGARTDIWINVLDQKRTILSLCIEVKGSWNSSTPTALHEQLVKQYMGSNAAQAGIYLVGWFDSLEYPKKNCWQNDRQKARNELSAQAKMEQAKGYLVQAVVINCDYRI